MKFTKPTKQVVETETLACRMPLARAAVFKAEVKKDGVSVSEAIKQLIENFLNLRSK